MVAFRQGLNETGYTEGRNVAIEELGAEGQFERTERLAAELANRGVALIVTSGNGSSLAAQSAAPAIPLVFLSQGDPLKFGLVNSLNRPGGNATGIALLAVDLLGKRLEVARQLAPIAGRIAVLFNSNGPEAEAQRVELKELSHRFAGQIEIISASSDNDLDPAFSTLSRLGVGVLVVSTDPFFFSRRNPILDLARRYAIPVVYDRREYVAAGGLISYGARYSEAYRQLGVYAGKVLSGAKPADLPVQQSSKVELVINLKVAKALDLAISSSLLARADEVIE
jgi:putative ABC transport system substrate-binding protein